MKRAPAKHAERGGHLRGTKRSAPIAHSTVPGSPPPRTAKPSTVSPLRERPRLPRREVARIVDQSDRTLVDVIDNLLNTGVVLNAEMILGLAEVDLIYVRLSALLCAADLLFPPEAS